MSAKGTRKVRLPLSNKANIARNTRRRKRIAGHRGAPNNGNSYQNRMRKAEKEIENKTKRESEHHIKMDKTVGALRKFNRKLKAAMAEYDEKMEELNANSNAVLDVSVFLDYIKQEVEAQREALRIHINPNSENEPPDYVDKLTDFIDDKIIKNYTNAVNITRRVESAKILLNIFNKSIELHSEAAEVLGIHVDDMAVNNNNL